MKDLKPLQEKLKTSGNFLNHKLQKAMYSKTKLLETHCVLQGHNKGLQGLLPHFPITGQRSESQFLQSNNFSSVFEVRQKHKSKATAIFLLYYQGKKD